MTRHQRPLRLLGRGGYCAVLVVAGVLLVAGSPGVASAHSRVKQPSRTAEMVCAPEVQHDIAEAIHTSTIEVPAATWNDALYSCRYLYTNGEVTLSVKDLANRASTSAYFRGLARTLGKDRDLGGLGEGAFLTTNGSMVVRKDNKVLLVDVAKLPAQFGNPPVASRDIATTLGITVLGCWTHD
jgi:hypothetical protein